MYPFQVWQDPGNYKWFIEFNGLMDTEAGYFDTKALAIEAGRKLVSTTGEE